MTSPASSPKKNNQTNDELHELARQHATRAVEFDRSNEYEKAYSHYIVNNLIS